MSITSTLYRQSLIAESNQAQLDMMRANSAERSLVNSNSRDLADVARREAEIQQQKLQAEVRKKAADAELSKRNAHKFDRYA